MCLKSNSMKTWLKVGTLGNLKKMVFIGIFHLEGMIDASFIQKLEHNKWAVIPGFVQNGLTRNAKVNYKKKFQRSL